MKYGDSEYARQIEVINTVPLSKIVDDPINELSDAAMKHCDEKHLRDLRDQVMAYDDEEAKVVAEALLEKGWTYSYNALGNYFERLVKQKEATKVINQA